MSIPEAYDKPITAAHLATHTAGFSVRARGDTASELSHLRPLAETVATYQPARVRPPGKVHTYTNYAAGLGGQLAADIMDTPFNTLARRQVFEPLEMGRSTFNQLPENIPVSIKEFTDAVTFYSDITPASGMWTTAADMAQFITVHLNQGSTESGTILSPEATAEMHRQWYQPHADLTGFAFGFMEEQRDGVRVLRHPGDFLTFSSDLVLIPELDIGLFVTAHGNEAGSAQRDLTDNLLEELAPTTENTVQPYGTPRHANLIECVYRSVHLTQHETYEKAIFAVAGFPRIDITITEDGVLELDQGGTTTQWAEVDPLVFDEINGTRTLVFEQDEGEITYLFVEGDAFSYEPVALTQQVNVQAGTLGASAAIVGVSTLGWTITAGWRRYRGSSQLSESNRRARWIAGSAAGCLFGFLMMIPVLSIILSAFGSPNLIDQPPQAMRVLFVLPIIGAIATAGTVIQAVRSWRNEWWSVWMRLQYTVVVCALVGLLWTFHYWNLRGFGF